MQESCHRFRKNKFLAMASFHVRMCLNSFRPQVLGVCFSVVAVAIRARLNIRVSMLVYNFQQFKDKVPFEATTNFIKMLA